MAKDALGKELEVGQTVLYATSMSSQLYKAKVKKVCGKMVILNTKHEQRKIHESVVIVSDSSIELTVELDVADSKIKSGLKPEDLPQQFAQGILEHLPNVDDDEEGTTRTVIVSSTTIVDGKEVI